MSRYVPAGKLAAVDPEALARMLLAEGWHELPGQPGVFRILQSPDGEADVAIPAHRDWADYRTRLNEALAGAEGILGDPADEFMRRLLDGTAGGPARRGARPRLRRGTGLDQADGTGAHLR
jgi:hypothetical protein